MIRPWPPRRIAAGWKVGITIRPSQVKRWPRTRVIPTWRFRMTRVAKFPSVTITLGSISCTCSSSRGLHASISSGSGSRLPGGRHRTTLAM